MDVPDDLDPESRSIAQKAHEIDPRVVAVRMHTKGFDSLLVIEMLDGAPKDIVALRNGLLEFCKRQGIPPGFLVTNSTTPTWSEFRSKPTIPEGWPPQPS